MKLCYLLLVPIILWLTINPCCGEEPEKESTACSENHSGDSGTTERHACSPFYGCGTCVGFIFTLPTYNYWEIDSPNLIEPSTINHFFYPKGNRTSLLKPPSGN